MDGEPPQEEDFSTIPLVDRSTHKNWKARLSAYNEVIAKSAKTASDTDPFFKPYVTDGGLLRKWCLDANAVAQEKGIEAVLAIVTNSGETSARLRPDIVPALVDKALGNSRAGTRKKGIDLCAMFVEVENTGDGVVGDLLPGLGAKLPKAVAGCVACLKEITESFGVPALGNVKPLLKVLPKIFGHSDKNVRAEGTALTLVLYTYLGPALMPALADLKPVQVSDLEKSFKTLEGEGKGPGSGKPQRWTRKAQRDREAAADGGGEDDGGAEEEEAAAIDPLSLLDPVDALALFPSDVMERLASSKWKERLEACEECNKVLAQPQNARISDANTGAYGTLVQTLGTKCHKDANVNVVMEAAKLLEGLARGLGKSFGQFRGVTMTGCLERLKERKASVVEALGKALDAIFLTTTLQDIVEDVLTALKSKNPQVKSGTLNFLHRSLTMTLDAPGKDQVKPMAEALVALLSDSAEPVRTAAAECLGTMMKILGERAFNPYIENVPELQMAKVKDAFSRAEIRYRPGGPKKAAAGRAPGKAAPRAAAKPAAASGPSSARQSPTKPAPAAPSSPPIKSSGKFDNDALVDEFAPPKRGPPARFLKPKAAPAADADDEPLVEAMAPPKRGPPARLMRPKPAPAADDGETLMDDTAPPARAPPARFARPRPAPADDGESLISDVAPPARAPPARFAKPKTAASSESGSGRSSPVKGGPPRAAAPKAAARPAPAAAKPAAAGKPGAAKGLATSPSEPVKYRYSPEEAMARAEEAIPDGYRTKLADSAWKVRLEAADEMVTWVGEEGGADVDSEVMMRFLCKVPGWGEKNFQVSGKLYQVMALMAEKSPTFGKPAASLIVGPLTDKLGDMKLKKPAGEALTTIAEKTSLAFVLAQSYESMTKQKAPKAQADALTWIKSQVIDFGIAGIPLRDLISFVKNALGSPNALVRSSATALLVQVKIFVGGDISGFIEDLNPQLLTTINKEFDKVDGQTPPEPTRTQADLKEVASSGGKGGKGGGDPLDELIPRVDLNKIVGQTSVINDAKSDAWKVRKEAFEALSGLLDVKSNQRLKPNMGEIGTVLKKAMADTNLSVKMLALGIITKIATGMGPPFDKYCRILVAAVASVCADQKATTRNMAITTLTAIADTCGSLDAMYSGIGTSLESTNPALRSSVLGWVAERLKAQAPTSSSDLAPLAAPVISCLEDRNGDVRKAASAVLPFVVARAGYSFVMDQTSNLKPASKATIVPLINNARDAAGGSETAEPAKPERPTKAAPTAAPRAAKVPAAKVPPPTPRAGSAGIAKPSIPPPGRSLAMKALSSAPTSRPLSSASNENGFGGGFGIKSRLAPPRSASAATMAPPAARVETPSGRTVPFLTSEPGPRGSRSRRDAARWSLDAGARADMYDYLHAQMEPHVNPDILTLLFSKDHRAEEDFMAALAVLAEFYDAETSPSFGLPVEDIETVQVANVDLALKYAALRLLSNNTQLANRCLEVVSNVLDTLSRLGERLTDVEVKLFVPALVMKLGDAKFGPRLAPIFEGLDKIIPASQVVQLLAQYGIEDKTAGKTCKNESLLLIEKAYRKRGSVLRKDDRGFYEAVAKCIADQGTRNAALNLMARLQLQGESRSLQAVIDGMPTSSKDMLANRRATMAASKAGSATPSVSRTAAVDSGPTSPRASSPRPRVLGTPAGSRLSRDLTGSPGPSRPASSRAIPTPGGRIPMASGSSTPGRSLQRPMSVASNASSTTGVPTKRMSRMQEPTVVAPGQSALPKPSMQPLARPPSAPTPSLSEASLCVQTMRTDDIEDAAEALKAVAMFVEEDDKEFQDIAIDLLDALNFQLELTASGPNGSPQRSELLEPRNLRRVKHLMRTIHVVFSSSKLGRQFPLEDLERLFRSIRKHYAVIELWNDEVNGTDEGQAASDIRDYMSMVLGSILGTPSREYVYVVLFNSLVELCKDMSLSDDPCNAGEIGVVLQCAYKRVRSIDQDLKLDRLGAGALLAILERFLQDIPPVEWRRRGKYRMPHGDLPLRVVKTLLQRIIVYTKDINVGIYDLLQEQFGTTADQTTVYSYIFRISSADTGPAPAAAVAPSRPESTIMPRRRSNGHGSERPTSIGSNPRSSGESLPAPPNKSPTREVSEAERLVRRLTETRDNEQRLDELYAFMKTSPENETEVREAISSKLNSAVQTFVWRALDRRSEDATPRSPPPASPIRSPVLTSPRTSFFGSTAVAASSGSADSGAPLSRPVSMLDPNIPADTQYAQLKAMFTNRSGRASMSAGITSGSSSTRASPTNPSNPLMRPMSVGSVAEVDNRPVMAHRPLSEIQPKSKSPEMTTL